MTLRMILVYVTVFVVTALLLAYISYQARFIIAGPTIDIYTTNTATEERTIALEGQAHNIVSITLNGRTIYTDENGYFKETLVLENGYTKATIRAKDRYGRSTAAQRSFVYQPASLADNS